MLQDVLTRLEHSGVLRFELQVEADNPRGIAFYRKLGFERPALIRDLRREHRIDPAFQPDERVDRHGFQIHFFFAPFKESPHYIERMTNASLGLRSMHVYHNCFYTTFTAAIPLMVNIGFDGRRRQSRHFPG